MQSQLVERFLIGKVKYIVPQAGQVRDVGIYQLTSNNYIAATR